MIKRVKEFRSNTLLAQERKFLENFESEILRGISTLSILSIINEHKVNGAYGYQILKDLEDKTNSILIIEDGTLYPILKKLEGEDIIESNKQKISGRTRKYYKLTIKGIKIYSHMNGFLTKLIESISSLIDINISLKKDNFYCPNCANKIDIRDPEIKFCEVCGLDIENLKRRLLNE